jgi:hypothetical protein
MVCHCSLGMKALMNPKMMQPKSYRLSLPWYLSGNDSAKIWISCSEMKTSHLLRWSALSKFFLSRYSGSLGHPLGVCSTCFNSYAWMLLALHLVDVLRPSYATWYPMNRQFILFVVVVPAQVGAYWCVFLLFHFHRTIHHRPMESLLIWTMFSTLSPRIFKPASTFQPSCIPPASTSLLSSLHSQPWLSLPLPFFWVKSDLAPFADPAHSFAPCSLLWCQAMSRAFKIS